MNVLILTPDGVGSTLLQRAITVFMNMSNFDKNIINLHELANGLEEHFSPTLNQMILGRSTDSGYSQSLPEIQQMLERADHYKTSRLAHYHLVRRKDSIAEQVDFYNYLSDNFFVIAGQRKSVFEYALNWGLKATTNKLNVYNQHERLEQLYSLKDRVTIDASSFKEHLSRYRSYLQWVSEYWNPNSTFVYEDYLHRLDDYVHNLDFFNGHTKTSWKEMSGVEWQKWNRCHKLLSDALLAGKSTQLLLTDQSSTKQLATIQQHLPVAEQQFLTENLEHYVNGRLCVEKLVEERIIPSNIPIKMQTLAEKKMLINNFDELIDVYNEWAEQYGFDAVDYNGLIQQSTEELSKWYTNDTIKLLN
jgi:hypothetical protein